METRRAREQSRALRACGGTSRLPGAGEVTTDSSSAPWQPRQRHTLPLADAMPLGEAGDDLDDVQGRRARVRRKGRAVVVLLARVTTRRDGVLDGDDRPAFVEPEQVERNEGVLHPEWIEPLL